MRMITVRQPWAWAIIHGGKDIENRSRNIAGSYRGPVAIHVAQADADNAPDSLWMAAARDCNTTVEREPGKGGARWQPRGVVIGVVNIESVHHDSDHGRNEADRCSSWAMADHWHLCLSDPRPLHTPVIAKGKLGLWKPDAPLARAIWQQQVNA